MGYANRETRYGLCAMGRQPSRGLPAEALDREEARLRQGYGGQPSRDSRAKVGAEEGIRTPTVLLPPAPQAGASASSATSAFEGC